MYPSQYPVPVPPTTDMSAPTNTSQTAYPQQYYNNYYQPHSYSQPPTLYQQPPPPLPSEDSAPPLPGPEEARPPLPTESTEPVQTQDESAKVTPPNGVVTSEPPIASQPAVSATQSTAQTTQYNYSGPEYQQASAWYGPGAYNQYAQPNWTQTSTPTTQPSAWQQPNSNQQLQWQQGWPPNQQYYSQQYYNQWGAWSGQLPWIPQSPGVASDQQPWPNYQYPPEGQANVQQWQTTPSASQDSYQHPPRSPGTPPLPVDPSTDSKQPSDQQEPQANNYREAPPQPSNYRDVPMQPANYKDEPEKPPNYRDIPSQPSAQSSQQPIYRDGPPNYREVPLPGHAGSKHQHSDYREVPPPGHAGSKHQHTDYREAPPPGHAGIKHQRSEYGGPEVSEVKRLRRDSRSPQDNKSAAPPPSSGTQPSEENTIQSNKWPPQFQGYVARAFAAAVSDSDKEYVHHVLDEELNRMFADKRQWDIDWDTYPLPTDRLYKARSTTRWDTPSPSLELTDRGRSPQLRIQQRRDSDSPKEGEGLRPGRGRGGRGRGGRGRGRGILGNAPAIGRGRGKKKKNKRGKNRFTIDTTPSQQLVKELNVEEKKRMTDRAQRFGKQGTTEGNRNFRKKISIDELLKRTLPPGGDDGMVYWQDRTVEGTCQNLEKRYLRLTSAPEPSVVRPLHVLRRSLEHVCTKWKAVRDYRYACEQLKSIRQDLTIQGIRNDFTVLVYETHGRVALENADHQEFNQCQTQLKALYGKGLAGHQAEFIAYRVLYFILTDKSADMSSVLKELTFDLRSTPCVEHALKVWSAWSLGNYHKFFKLYKSAPNLSGALIDMFVTKERKRALKAMTKAFRPSVRVDYVSSALGFSCSDDCLVFLLEAEAVLNEDQTIVDCKLTAAKL